MNETNQNPVRTPIHRCADCAKFNDKCQLGLLWMDPENCPYFTSREDKE